MVRGFMDVRRAMKAMEGHTQMIRIDPYSVYISAQRARSHQSAIVA
jgi:hypothetical protein